MTRHPTTGRRAARRERGVTLLIALIMLTALSLLAGWAARSATTNLRAVGNMQVRQEALAAAQSALERTVSSREFADSPAALDGRQIPIDVDGDGTPDQTAQITPSPTCYRLRYVKQNELDDSIASDRRCLRSGAAAAAGIEGGSTGASNGDSYCAETDWAVRAQVVDPVSGARVSVTQGTVVRDAIPKSSQICP